MPPGFLIQCYNVLPTRLITDVGLGCCVGRVGRVGVRDERSL